MGASSMDGCGNFMKYSLFIINFIIFIGGIIGTALGIWTLVDRSFANELLGTNLYSGSAYVLVITGLLVVLISCLGCLGSVKEVRCMLVINYHIMYMEGCRRHISKRISVNGVNGQLDASYMTDFEAIIVTDSYDEIEEYFIALFLIFVTMLIGGILGYVFRAKVEKTIRLGMDRSLSDYGSYRPITEAWDETQQRLKCCGVYDYTDWKDRIPESCCKTTSSGQPLSCRQIEIKNDFTMYTRGCLTVTMNFVKSHAVIIGTAGIVVSCFLVLGMIFSCALFKLIK